MIRAAIGAALGFLWGTVVLGFAGYIVLMLAGVV
jgi:hypothetical protein